ncbi:MAG: extracellular solute-binding protein family 1 [Armatimonadetes bacterium]|nr:extracellular solute-binding protein family 1 [Armatimonadota bacterium]
MSLQDPSGTRLTRRRLLGAGASAATALAGGGCIARQTAASRRGERRITVWHPWGGVMVPRFQKILAAFRAAHPEIRVEGVYTQNNLSTNQKFFTSIAAGTPPDVTFVDGPQVASWAEWGALEPLTERATASAVKAEEYFPPTWRQNLYKDQVWALTYCADPNFGFAWNRSAFRKAGMDPDRPPTTIVELSEAMNRLTHTEGGVIRQIGLIPWAQYGPPNSMFTWGWAFGGEFYDPAAQKITADHPRVVKALEWMIETAKKNDPARLASIQKEIGSADANPFYSGRLGMQCLHIGGVRDIERYAPDLDYGVTYLPAPEDGEARSSWVGGWCMGIPKGAANPDDAWTFIHWLCHTPEGTGTVGREAGIFPGFRQSPYFAEVQSKKYYSDYARILSESKHQRPVMPVQAYYMRELLRAVDSAVFGRMTPAEALARVRTNTQAELDLALAGAQPA